jgi:hypothetical protein
MNASYLIEQTLEAPALDPVSLRAEWPVQPVQDPPEPEQPPMKEPLSDDDERHDSPPLRT